MGGIGVMQQFTEFEVQELHQVQRGGGHPARAQIEQGVEESEIGSPDGVVAYLGKEPGEGHEQSVVDERVDDLYQKREHVVVE